MIDGLERRVGFDMNDDGYIGGQGFMSGLERATHIDFNHDNIIGRPGGYPSMYGGTLPPTAYGSFPNMGYGADTYGYY